EEHRLHRENSGCGGAGAGCDAVPLDAGGADGFVIDSSFHAAKIRSLVAQGKRLPPIRRLHRKKRIARGGAFLHVGDKPTHGDPIMSFRITGLPAAPFADLFLLSDTELAARGAVRKIADSKPGYPCRISLTDAEPGQKVILTHFEHHSVDSPYR